ncbi:hypothetical protein L7F22_039524 [Adiantum nelumboides]|nr:hypothetical protein [Adiantum nelumboides]
MANNNKETRMSIDDFDFAHEDATDDTSMLINYLVSRLQQAMGNLALQGEVQQQLHAYRILPPPQQERDPKKSQGETSKRGLSMAREEENPYQELKKLLEDLPSSKKKGHVQHEGSPSKEREGSESQDESMEDVAPRRRRAQRSPTPTKRKRSPHSPHRRESKREGKNSRKKKVTLFSTMSHLELLKLKLHKRMLIAGKFSFPILEKTSRDESCLSLTEFSMGSPTPGARKVNVLAEKSNTLDLKAKKVLPSKELITGKGLPKETLPTKSGYLPISGTSKSKLFYVFYEATQPQAPLVDTPWLLWLNGGPGCSSLIGCFYEIGPWWIMQDGSILRNRGAWNRR